VRLVENRSRNRHRIASPASGAKQQRNEFGIRKRFRAERVHTLAGQISVMGPGRNVLGQMSWKGRTIACRDLVRCGHGHC
jgi:hypothetical protein